MEEDGRLFGESSSEAAAGRPGRSMVDQIKSGHVWRGLPRDSTRDVAAWDAGNVFALLPGNCLTKLDRIEWMKCRKTEIYMHTYLSAWCRIVQSWHGRVGGAGTGAAGPESRGREY